MARQLLNLARMTTVLAGTAGATACVIPPNAELEQQDAGHRAPPVIVSSGPGDFAVPGPLILERGSDEDIVLTVVDNDLESDLYVRMYVNYPDDTSVRAECQVGPSGERERIIECPTRRLCDGVADEDTSRQFLEALVANRAFLPDNHEEAESQDPNRALPDDAGFSFRAWMLICLEDD